MLSWRDTRTVASDASGGGGGLGRENVIGKVVRVLAWKK
jgi:hypothetical protein